MKSGDTDPAAFTLPVNSVAQFWKKLFFFDAMCSWQIHVSCSLSTCSVNTFWCLFCLVQFVLWFFFLETEVNLDVNLLSFYFFLFLNWGFYFPFLSPLRSILSSMSSSQQLWAYFRKCFKYSRTFYQNSWKHGHYPMTWFSFTVGNNTCLVLGFVCASHQLLLDF